jgi:hypothetical protein
MDTMVKLSPVNIMKLCYIRLKQRKMDDAADMFLKTLLGNVSSKDSFLDIEIPADIVKELRELYDGGEEEFDLIFRARKV